MTGEYSLSDIAAATGNGSSNGGAWGENGSWWIVLFLIFAIFGWGGNRGGIGGGSNSGAADNYVLASDFATIQRQLSDGFNSIDNALDRQNAGICDLGYTTQSLINGVNQNVSNVGFAVQNAITQDTRANMQGFNAMQAQLAQCCCDNKAATADVKNAIYFYLLIFQWFFDVVLIHTQHG